MTTVYLAWASAATETLAAHDAPVNLLVAFPVLAQFLRVRHRFHIGSWCLDSGAFSAFNAGTKIVLSDYIAACKDVDAVEVFGLDVIGDPEGSKRNLDRMWSAGVPAIPTWHGGESWEVLGWCAKHASKIAFGSGAQSLRAAKGLGGSRGANSKTWTLQAFARVWPKKVHGFGMAAPDKLAWAPFHSVDASSWIYAPAAMGRWAGFTGHQMAVRARGKLDYWVEVEEHMKRERWAKWRWRRELAQLEAA